MCTGPILRDKKLLVKYFVNVFRISVIHESLWHREIALIDPKWVDSVSMATDTQLKHRGYISWQVVFRADSSVKIGGFHENRRISHWLLERSLSGCVSFYFLRFSHWKPHIFTENHLFSLKTGGFHENQQISLKLAYFMKTSRFHTENWHISWKLADFGENWRFSWNPPIFSVKTWLAFSLYSMKDQDKVSDLCRISCF